MFISNLGKRWYDNDPYLVNTFKLLSLLDEKTLEIVSGQIIKEVQDLRKRTGKKVETDKILGMYKAENKRRNADEKPSLKGATTALSTIPLADCKIILECIFEVLKDSREEMKKKANAWKNQHYYFEKSYKSPYVLQEEVLDETFGVWEEPLI